MKSKRSLTQKKQAPGASFSSMNPWSWIVSPRFTSILLIAAIGLCAIHLLFRQERDAIQSPLEKLYPPEILYFLKQAGLTDVFHSGWVVVVFSLLFLNLFCVFLDQLPLVFQWLARRSPRPISMESVFPKKKGVPRSAQFLGLEISTTLGLRAAERDEFRQLIVRWAKRHRLGRAQVVQDGGEKTEIQLSVRAGGVASLGYALLLLGALLMIVGGFWEAVGGFEGRMKIQEGTKSEAIEVIRTNALLWPRWIRDWVPRPESGSSSSTGSSGLRVSPGLEVELSRVDLLAQSQSFLPDFARGQLSFYRVGRLLGVGDLRGKGVDGLRFFSLRQDLNQLDKNKLNVKISDRKTGETQAQTLFLDQDYALPGASLRWIGLNLPAPYSIEPPWAPTPAIEESNLGLSAQFDYRENREDGQPAVSENFWAFARYPAYDEVRRKNSRYTVVVRSVEPISNAVIQVLWQPGRKLSVVGAVLLFLGMVLWVFPRQRSYWFSLAEGRVLIAAQASPFFRIYSEFEELSKDLRSEMAKLQDMMELRLGFLSTDQDEADLQAEFMKFNKKKKEGAKNDSF